MTKLSETRTKPVCDYTLPPAVTQIKKKGHLSYHTNLNRLNDITMIHNKN